MIYLTKRSWKEIEFIYGGLCWMFLCPGLRWRFAKLNLGVTPDRSDKMSRCVTSLCNSSRQLSNAYTNRQLFML